MARRWGPAQLQKEDTVISMKLGFLSLGCPKNLVDGEVMLGLARDAGHDVTADASDAEVIVVNTCAFIDAAKEESINAILEMAQFKRGGSCKRLVVTGCLGERYRDELKAEIPEIDVVLGTGEVPEIVGALNGFQPPAVPMRLFRSGELGTSEPNKRTSDPRHSGTPAPTYLYDAATPRLQTTPKHYAYVKVAEGCDYTCAFCIIPTLRGKFRSREETSILSEARRLAASGVRELLLISQDTTFFGIDRGERGALARLLRQLNEIEGLSWIRLLYLYPTTITDDVLDAMADCDKVCKYIDLPLQHASADVLRRMRRPGNRPMYDKLLSRIRTRVADVTLRTTLIVGFPGETESDFEELKAFVRDTQFDHLGVFTYSHEEGTRAFDMDDDVPAAVKQARRDELMRLQRDIVARRMETRIGRQITVMVDGPAADSDLVLTARLEGQAPDIDAIVYLDECDPSAFRPGDVISAVVTSAKGYDLVARPLVAVAG
jgi:ribosomal protein S12 methylthiotransferase